MAKGDSAVQGWLQGLWGTIVFSTCEAMRGLRKYRGLSGARPGPQPPKPVKSGWVVCTTKPRGFSFKKQNNVKDTSQHRADEARSQPDHKKQGRRQDTSCGPSLPTPKPKPDTTTWLRPESASVPQSPPANPG